MRYLLIIIFLINFENLQASFLMIESLQDAEKHSPFELQNYMQKSYSLDDPAGDYALLKRSELVPKRIFSRIFNVDLKDDVPPPVDAEKYELEAKLELESTLINVPDDKFTKNDSNEEKLLSYCKRNPMIKSLFTNVYNSFGEVNADQMEKLLIGIKNIGMPIQGRDNPFRRDGLKKMFAQIIVEEKEHGIEPKFGEPHRWSKEFLDKHGKSSPMLMSSKILMALAVGETNRYMKTEKEGELYKWLLNAKENSLELADVFRQSYIINDGDIYKAILTIENVLAHQWQNPDREQLPFLKKLKPITSGHEYEQDKFGTWYHFFGIMLYGYTEGGIKANVVGRIENLGSQILYPNVDITQKGWVNKIGGLAGGDLSQLIKNKEYLNHQSNPNDTKFENYMNLNENFLDRIQVPLDKSIKANFTVDLENHRTSVDLKDLKKRELKNCQIEIYPDFGKGFDARSKLEYNDFEIKDFHSTLYMQNVNIKRVRGFIKCKNIDEIMAFETSFN